MKKISTIASLLIIGAQLVTPALAATIIPCGTSEPELLLSKFSFNSTTDFIELTVMNDGNGGGGATLNNWKLGTIDTTLKTLTNFSVRTGESYTFKDIGGLTATTDQLVITNDKNEIRDAVCWTSTPPTVQEQSDFSKLGNQWNGIISTCIPSDKLPKETIFTRKNGQDTNGGADWYTAAVGAAAPVPASTPVPNAPTPLPVSTPTPAPGTVPPAGAIATNEVIINELLPDPEGSDDNTEWIELKNTSDHTVSLSGWKLDDEEGGSKPYAFQQESIGAESFLVMSSAVTHLTLNNSKDSARLINPTGTVTSNYTYQKVETNKSWARMFDNSWEVTEILTPGEENHVTSAPTATPNSSASPELTPDTSLDGTSLPDSISNPSPPIDTTPIAISEVFPNPTGTDNGGEWIEIHNQAKMTIDLSGWKIKNAAGKTFTFPDSTFLPGQNYLVITDKITKIELKNTGDTVKILNPDGEVQDQIQFQTAPEKVSFAKISTVGLEDEKIISATNWLTPFTPLTAYAQEISPKQEAIPESTWEWTDMITKGKPNPTYYRIKGNIIEEPNATNTFTIERNGKKSIIQFDPQKIHADVLKAALTKGASIEITVVEKGKDSTLTLETYKTIDESSSTTTSQNILIPFLLSIALIGIAIAVFTYFKKKKFLLEKTYTPS